MFIFNIDFSSYLEVADEPTPATIDQQNNYDNISDSEIENEEEIATDSISTSNGSTNNRGSAHEKNTDNETLAATVEINSNHFDSNYDQYATVIKHKNTNENHNNLNNGHVTTGENTDTIYQYIFDREGKV